MIRLMLIFAATLIASPVLAQSPIVAAPGAQPPGTPKAVPPPPRTVDEQNTIRVLLAPALETTLVSPFAGRIRQVSVTLGQSFAKGRTLISFDCDEPLARLQMAEAELASARESHDAKLRLQGLQQAGEVEVSLAASAAERARAQAALYRAQLAQCSVTAPFSGRAVKIAVKSHQGVTQGQPLLELVSDGSLKLRLNAPAKWLAWMKTGTGFAVAIDETGRSYKARVTAINARVDAVSQSVELEAVIVGAAPDLLPGMSGVARFSPPH
jgi:RND family efflux transporter MFP subunit